MKKKIAILGSTGSIGKTLIDIISKDKNNFKIDLLSANKNYKQILKQAIKFNVKNLIITDKKAFVKLQNQIKKRNIRIFNSFDHFIKNYKSKFDYSMCAITGIDGLKPTLDIIRLSKAVAIANKEAIICGWPLIKKSLKKYNTKFIPVDSEHFTIWMATNNFKHSIEKIFITASGGPFKDLDIKKFKHITPNQAVKHPNWKMGNKISIDSSTMMNKVFEIIEAKNIFNIKYQQIDILIHKDSYLHSIIKFQNGIIKIVAHDTTMKVPIFNSIYNNESKTIKTQDVSISKLNNLKLEKPNNKRFKILKILNFLPDKTSLFETAIVTANDILVDLFLNNKISYLDISKKLYKFIKLKKIKNFKHVAPKNIQDILGLNVYIRENFDFTRL